jgi:Ion channel/TrkA-N domain
VNKSKNILSGIRANLLSIAKKVRGFVYGRLESQSATAAFIFLEIEKELFKSKWPVIIWVSYFLFNWGIFISFEPVDNDITNWINYLYFVSALSSTVGLGDVAPVSEMGRLVSAFSFNFYPAFLVAYGAMLVKDFWKISYKIYHGDIIVSIKDHIPIISFQRNRTNIIIDNILADTRREKRQLLLCFDKERYDKNPMSGIVSGKSTKTGFKSDKFLKEARIADAARILIDTGDDNYNIALCIIMRNVNPKAHIVVAFDVMHENAPVVKLLGENIEPVPTSMPELIARCIQDPGSSYTMMDMIDADGQTKYRLQVPEDFDGCSWDDLKRFFKSGNNKADAIAAGHKAGGKLEVNPPKSRCIEAGMFIEYLRSKRFKEGMIKWDKISQEHAV